MSKHLRQVVGSVAVAGFLGLPATGWGAGPTTAVPTSDFLDSIGIVTTFPDRGQPLDKTVEMVRYCGFRWVRAGIEGLSEDGPTTMKTLVVSLLVDLAR